jgi:hypothetical protein
MQTTIRSLIMDLSALATDITAVQGVAGTILATIEAVDPAVALPAATAGTVVVLLGDMVTAALTAWSNASGIPITVESITALLPDPTPLPLPPEGA